MQLQATSTPLIMHKDSSFASWDNNSVGENQDFCPGNMRQNPFEQAFHLCLALVFQCPTKWPKFQKPHWNLFSRCCVSAQTLCCSLALHMCCRQECMVLCTTTRISSCFFLVCSAASLADSPDNFLLEMRDQHCSLCLASHCTTTFFASSCLFLVSKGGVHLVGIATMIVVHCEGSCHHTLNLPEKP